MLIEKTQRAFIKNKGPILYMAVFLIFCVGSISWLVNMESQYVSKGEWNLVEADFDPEKAYPLNGEWEFYWDKLLEPGDFANKTLPAMDGYMKVPGSWSDRQAGAKVFPAHGLATYKMHITIPSQIKDPAIKIKRVSRSVSVYANDQFIAEVGKVSADMEVYEAGYAILIEDLPKDIGEIDLILQIADFDYPRGGIRESFLFGSKSVLERQEMSLLFIQLIFIGSVLIFAIYYLILFFLNKKNRTALFFSILCMNSVARGLIWGESPIRFILPNASVDLGIFINYLTGYLLIPIILMFVATIYPKIFIKKWILIVLAPNAFFLTLLLTPIENMAAHFTDLFYLVALAQMVYMIGLFRAMILRMDHSVVLFFSIGLMLLGIFVDIINYKNFINTYITYASPISNLAIIIAMSFIQSKQQMDEHKKLIVYNEQLIEADRLKDKIMATENAFLQAQIKPHFLFNTLNSIASLAYKDGEKASDLIGYLSTYLRNSMDNENLNLTVSIEKELELVEAYETIEKVRFNELVTFEKELPLNLYFKIPPVTIQPIIENAVKHGLKSSRAGIRVKLTISEEDKAYLITITDNGKGIDQETLENIFAESLDNKSIGLINIHTRLTRLYGSGLAIKSEMNKGTEVTFRIPKGNGYD